VIRLHKTTGIAGYLKGYPMNLINIKDSIRSYPGVTRKRPIQDIYTQLVSSPQLENQLPSYGDDAAIIPNGDGYLLFAADGIMPSLLVNEPYAAGKAAVMVCVNDIYAMGGRPLAMVNVLGCRDEKMKNEIIRGLKKGCEKLQVAIVGGHLHPDSPHPSLSLATLGFAKKVMRSHLAKAGQHIIAAIDLVGDPGCHSVMSWDSHSGKSSKEILNRLEALPEIAEKELSNCCKDVSNAGLLGTLSIMMENSGKGAVIDMNKIPIPEGMGIIPWCLSFQGIGFILSVDPENSPALVDIFKKRDVAAQVVGHVTADRKIIIREGNETEVLFDFSHEKITGISCLNNADNGP